MSIIMIIFLSSTIFLSMCFLCGFMSMSLQAQKGYDGGFWIGFLLGVLGVIYSAGLPLKKDNAVHKQVNRISYNRKIADIEDDDESSTLL